MPVAGLLRRPLPRREGADELLGLLDARLPRARDTLHLRGRGLPRVQVDGEAPARGGHRGDPRRGLQPHRRGQPPGADPLVPRHRQRGLLPAQQGGPALLLRHDGHGQHGQHAPPARAADGDGLAPLLGRGMPYRRLPLRPRLHARARLRRVRPALVLPGGGGAGPDIAERQDDRRAVGRGRQRLPARQLPARLGRMERPLPRRRALVLEDGRGLHGRHRLRAHRLGRAVRPSRPQALGVGQLRHRP